MNQNELRQALIEAFDEQVEGDPKLSELSTMGLADLAISVFVRLESQPAPSAASIVKYLYENDMVIYTNRSSFTRSGTVDEEEAVEILEKALAQGRP